MTRFLAVPVLLAALAPPLRAQSVQYRSPSGVEYRSQPDTGAIARAQAALAADPANVSLILQLGLAQAARRQYREAIATWSRGLERAPDDVMLYRWRGHRHLSVREFDRALADLTRGLEFDPANYGVLYHLGIVRMVRGEFDAAADVFRRAQALVPEAGELAGSTDWLWMALSRAGRRAEADEVLAARPDSFPVANAYARRLRLYRGQVGPDQLITPADTDGVTLATLHYGLGNWYLVRGDSAIAKSHFAQAVQASDGWPAFGFILAEQELKRMR